MDVKQVVKKRYGQIAQGRGGCCGAAPRGERLSAEKAARTVGYAAGDLDAVPEGANLGLGCGNPLALALVKPGDVVLDLGSGAGFDAFLAVPRVGPEGRVIGVDMTEEMIAQARANAERAGYTNVEFRLGEIESLPVEDSSVDLVISNCVLNLVPDKPAAFRELVRVLKPGGRLAISDIVLDRPLPAELADDPDAWCACVGGAISRQEYLQGLREAGLVQVEVMSEADAAPLLAGECCGEGAELPAGMATSIAVTGRKPLSGGKQ